MQRRISKKKTKKQKVKQEEKKEEQTAEEVKVEMPEGLSEEDLKNVESELMLRSVAYCEARIAEIDQTLKRQVANGERPDKKLRELNKVCNRMKAQIEMGC